MQFIHACAAVLACFAPGRWNSLNEPKHRTNDIKQNGPSSRQIPLVKREPGIARVLRSISRTTRGERLGSSVVFACLVSPGAVCVWPLAPAPAQVVLTEFCKKKE
jgi:hypothetical protein